MMNVDQASYDVLAIGELNADLVFIGLKSGPELNKEILAKSYQKTLGSSTAICVSSLAQLGLKSAFCGKVGDDENGHYVLDQLKQRGIDTTFCKIDPSVDTGVTLSLSWGGDRALVTVLAAISDFSLKDIDMDIIKIARHIHVGSFFLQTGLQKDLEQIFKEARRHGITTSLDTGWDDTGNWDCGISSVLKYTDIFLPNETEALNITKETSVERAAEILSKQCKTVVVKCGSDGAICFSQRKRYAKGSMKGIKVVDTTGAGDSFNAGFIYGFLNQFSIDECLTYGNACGAISVMSVGGATAEITIEKVNAFMAGQ